MSGRMCETNQMTDCVDECLFPFCDIDEEFADGDSDGAGEF